MRTLVLVLIFGAVPLLVACGDSRDPLSAGDAVASEPARKGSEHAGAEHAGAEHAGAEHAGQEHAGKEAATVTAEDIKAAMTAHIEAETKKGGGALAIRDEVTGEDLRLEFVRIHDPVRRIEGKGYFACTDFHPVGAPADKLYDLDFWLDQKDGALVVTETKIHKHPKAEGDGWVKEARYTFVDDEPVVVE